MASEAHEGVKLVDLHVIDATIYAVDPFEHKRDTLKLLMPWRAFENFALNNGQVASLNGQHKTVVEDKIVHRLDSDKGLLSFSGRGRPALVKDKLLIAGVDWHEGIRLNLKMRVGVWIENPHLS